MTFALQENIKTEAITIRGILSTHHKLMSEIRTILKSMAKVGQQNIINCIIC